MDYLVIIIPLPMFIKSMKKNTIAGLYGLERFGILHKRVLKIW